MTAVKLAAFQFYEVGLILLNRVKKGVKNLFFFLFNLTINLAQFRIILLKNNIFYITIFIAFVLPIIVLSVFRQDHSRRIYFR